MDKHKNSNKTEIHGNVTINGFAQIGNNNNFDSQKKEEENKALYDPVPIWRSPFTMAVLTWLSAILGVLSLGSGYTLIQSLKNWNWNDSDNRKAVFFGVCLFMTLALLSIRSFTKKQIRVPMPIVRGIAVCGRGERLTIERVRPGKCPICGGEMYYFNKPLEWKEYTNGKREITKRRPALQCKRNPDHFFWVDVAEDTIE